MDTVGVFIQQAVHLQERWAFGRRRCSVVIHSDEKYGVMCILLCMQERKKHSRESGEALVYFI